MAARTAPLPTSASGAYSPTSARWSCQAAVYYLCLGAPSSLQLTCWPCFRWYPMQNRWLARTLRKCDNGGRRCWSIEFPAAGECDANRAACPHGVAAGQGQNERRADRSKPGYWEILAGISAAGQTFLRQPLRPRARLTTSAEHKRLPPRLGSASASPDPSARGRERPGMDAAADHKHMHGSCRMGYPHSWQPQGLLGSLAQQLLHQCSTLESCPPSV